LNRILFEENSVYVRTALVAYNAVFHDPGDRSQKQHLMWQPPGNQAAPQERVRKDQCRKGHFRERVRESPAHARRISANGCER